MFIFLTLRGKDTAIFLPVHRKYEKNVVFLLLALHIGGQSDTRKQRKSSKERSLQQKGTLPTAERSAPYSRKERSPPQKGAHPTAERSAPFYVIPLSFPPYVTTIT